MNDIVILNTAGTSADGHSIPLYVRLPKNASKAHPCGAVLLLCGLDGHRPDNTTRSDEFLTYVEKHITIEEKSQLTFLAEAGHLS